MSRRKKYTSNFDRPNITDRYKMHVDEQGSQKIATVSRLVVLEHRKAFESAIEQAMNDLATMPKSPLYDISQTSKRDETSLEYKWIYKLTTKTKTSNSLDTLFNDRPKLAHDCSLIITLSACSISIEIEHENKSENRSITYKILDQLPEMTGNTIEYETLDMSDALDTATSQTKLKLAEWISTYCKDHAAIFFMDHPQLLTKPAKQNKHKPTTGQKTYR